MLGFKYEYTGIDKCALSGFKKIRLDYACLSKISSSFVKTDEYDFTT